MTEATRQRRSISDEITKLTKTLNLVREVNEREKEKAVEELEQFRKTLDTRRLRLSDDIARLEGRKQDIEKSLEHLDLERRRVAVGERESLVKKKFEEFQVWEAKLKEQEGYLSEKFRQHSDDEKRIYANFLDLDAGRKEVIQREKALSASEQSLVERMKVIDLTLRKREQEIVLREHELDLKEFELKEMKKVYEEGLNHPPEPPKPNVKSLVFTA